MVVTALPSEQIEARYRALAHPPRRVYVLAGALAELPDAWTPNDAGLRLRGVLVTSLGQGSTTQRQLARTRGWLNRRKLQPGSEKIASNALLAAVVTFETLAHIDERFSREYCIEKIEHNLENMPAMTAYPRLSIGPSQRFAAKSIELRPMADRSGALGAGAVSMRD